MKRIEFNAGHPKKKSVFHRMAFKKPEGYHPRLLRILETLCGKRPGIDDKLRYFKPGELHRYASMNACLKCEKINEARTKKKGKGTRTTQSRKNTSATEYTLSSMGMVSGSTPTATRTRLIKST